MVNHPKQLIPTDPLFSQQWHLLNTGQIPGSVAGFDTNVTRVWPDYTGLGILVAVLDDGFDETHPDLVGNYRSNFAWDFSLNKPGANAVSDEDNHGTPVAGLVSSLANNGIGGVGTAWGANIIGYRMAMDGKTNATQSSSIFDDVVPKIMQSGASVFTNSWGLMSTPFDAQILQTKLVNSTQNLAANGRGGLGVITLFAAGNDRESKFNTNYDPTNNSPFTISVAASMANGQITSYSTPGASILVTSPGSDPASIVSTDRQGNKGYNTLLGADGNYTNSSESYFNGTSAATPIAAGVVALILHANPNLGYRDVQEILVYSSKRAVFLNQPGVETTVNGATNWNGGGLITGYDFGYGNIDSLAAVRLAESWQKQSTISNLQIINGVSENNQLNLHAGGTGTVIANFISNNRVEQVTVSLDLSTDRLQDIRVVLVSPNGTSSVLVDYPPEVDGEKLTPLLTYTLNTVRNWGETLKGDWTLRLENKITGSQAILHDWSIQAYTALPTANQAQIFTDEFNTFATRDASRLNLISADGNIINTAAVSAASRLDLTGGPSHIGGTSVTLVDHHNFKAIIGGDGNDTLIGNALDNLLIGGRGRNNINGGDGIDTLVVSGLPSQYSFTANTPSGVDGTLTGVYGVDTLTSIEFIRFGSSLGNDIFVSNLMPSQLVDPDGNGPRLSQAKELLQGISALYMAVFSRAPEQSGLLYWMSQANKSANVFESIANGFTQHPVFTEVYGSLNNSAFVNALYVNILGGPGDVGGVNYWVNELSVKTRAQVLSSLVQSALEIDLTVGAAALGLNDIELTAAEARQNRIINKSKVGVSFAELLGSASNLANDTNPSTLSGLQADPAFRASVEAIKSVSDNKSTLDNAIANLSAAVASGNPIAFLVNANINSASSTSFVSASTTDTDTSLDMLLASSFDDAIAFSDLILVGVVDIV